MKEIDTKVDRSLDNGSYREFGEQEVYSPANQTVCQEQEFKRIMDVSWPSGFPALEAELPVTDTNESTAAIAELPETLVCRTVDDYERQENIAWQRYETLVTYYWANYTRISEDAWLKRCATEQIAWQLYEESIAPARLKFEQERYAVHVRQDKAAILALKMEYAENTKFIRQWRIATIQTAYDEYEQFIKNARSEYDQVEISAKLVYDRIVKSLRAALEQSPDSHADVLEEAA